MKHALFVLIALLPGLALAQPETLQLDRDNVYLSRVSQNLDGLSSYRQHYRALTVETGADGAVTESRYEWSAEKAETQDRLEREFNEGPYMTVTRADYLVGGQAYSYTNAGEGAVFCMPMPAFNPASAAITVSDVTGFRTATLAESGVNVNGILADRYTLDRPEFNNYYDVESLEGELWMAQEGGYIVKFSIRASAGSTVVTWDYDLMDVGEVEALELPLECMAG